MTNKITDQDFSDYEKIVYFALCGKCVSNIKQAIAEVEGAMRKVFGVQAVEATGRVNRYKMLQKGHLRTKENPKNEQTA